MVILDNGHGSNTPGKRSPKGMCTTPDNTALYEYELTRNIVCRIISMIDQYNRTHSPSEEILYKRLVPEISDISLPERVHRANVIYRAYPDSYLLSVHANAGGGSGFEFFTSVGETKSDQIAELFYDEAKEMFPQFKMRTDMADGDRDKEAHFFILKHTLCPAVLTENLFYDNETDLKYLLTDEGREQIARLHFNVILKMSGK